MNLPIQRKNVSVSSSSSLSDAPANDTTALRLVPKPRQAHDLDPFTRGYRKLTPKLRAACVRYVDRRDVDDLVQDVWTVASRSPAKLTQSDARTLSWLIGIAKRCSPSYASVKSGFLPLDALLAGESGDDLEGRAFHEDVTELAVELWGRND
jgi:DNA-directed RNA polymerase specialized sigma24 family protein